MSYSTKEKGTRIAKIIANSGYCSRREAEKLIAAGEVKVNGKVIDSPATLITDQSIKIHNKLLQQSQEKRIWLFHKPSGYLTTNSDPENRKTIFEILPKEMPRVVTVGRLDMNTEGLLILTTNGDLARFMELPKNKWVRTYRARVFGKLDHERLKKLSRGITIDSIRYEPIKVEIESEKNANSWLKISITEGKNREIRKVMEYLGLQVSRLIRISFGPFKLETIPAGKCHEIPKNIYQKILTQIDH